MEPVCRFEDRLKAIARPSGHRILASLSNNGRATVTILARRLGITEHCVSDNVALLLSLGLVSLKIINGKRVFSTDTDGIAELAAAVSALGRGSLQRDETAA